MPSLNFLDDTTTIPPNLLHVLDLVWRGVYFVQLYLIFGQLATETVSRLLPDLQMSRCLDERARKRKMPCEHYCHPHSARAKTFESISCTRLIRGRAQYSWWLTLSPDIRYLD
jgi:hypothetical protein